MSDEYEAATSPISGIVRYRLESPFRMVTIASSPSRAEHTLV